MVEVADAAGMVVSPGREGGGSSAVEVVAAVVTVDADDVEGETSGAAVAGAGSGGEGSEVQPTSRSPTASQATPWPADLFINALCFFRMTMKATRFRDRRPAGESTHGRRDGCT